MDGTMDRLTNRVTYIGGCTQLTKLGKGTADFLMRWFIVIDNAECEEKRKSQGHFHGYSSFQKRLRNQGYNCYSSKIKRANLSFFLV